MDPVAGNGPKTCRRGLRGDPASPRYDPKMFWSYRSTGSYPPYPIHNERRVLMTINRRPTERTKRT